MNEDTRAPGAPQGQLDNTDTGKKPDLPCAGPHDVQSENSPRPSSALPPAASPEAVAGMSTPPAAPVDPGANAEAGNVLSQATAPAPAGNGRLAGRKRLFTRELFERVIERVQSGTFVRGAITAEGIAPSTFYKNLSPDDLATLKQAQLCGPVLAAEAELYRRGVQGTLKPIYQGGKLAGEVREYDTTALIFYLKCNYPAKYAAPDAAVAIHNNVTMETQSTIEAQAKTIEMFQKLTFEQTESERKAVALWEDIQARRKLHGAEELRRQ